MAKKLCVSGALCKMMKFGLVVMLSYSSSRCVKCLNGAMSIIKSIKPEMTEKYKNEIES